MLAAVFEDQLIALNVFEYGRLIDRPVRHTFRFYFTHHIHSLIPGRFPVIEIRAKTALPRLFAEAPKPPVTR